MKKKILIIHDIREERKKIKAFLEGLGCIADEALNGEQAFEYCMSRRPDAMVVYSKLQNQDGLSFLKLYHDTIGQFQKLPPVIFCIDDKKDPNAEPALKDGAKVLLVYPLTVKKIDTCLKKIFV
ncbi:MAG: hypothetical protein C0432_01280 [Candidatus Puniceispirillum sp.]|nr:hypothetical protein [Candidatus Pelagibacter sp.]MBA4282913.1 hypothetical protein [Candidatus Puniceispirillum sp.]